MTAEGWLQHIPKALMQASTTLEISCMSSEPTLSEGFKVQLSA